jgi:hypothetical protein
MLLLLDSIDEAYFEMSYQGKVVHDDERFV